MKIISLVRNESNQVVAEVLTCGKKIRTMAWNLDDLVDKIYRCAYFCTKDDVRLDLQLNYADFK